MRKIITLVVMLLFLGMTISSTTGFNLEKQSTIETFDGNTFYVDDDFNESTPGWNVTHFNKIQKAIGASAHNDTVFVYSGFYDEYYPSKWCSVFIDKKINLVGEDKYTTIIDGGHNDEVIRIYADDIHISGFTIQNSGNDGAGIKTGNIISENMSVHDNIIKDNQYGIYQAGTEYFHINNNIFSNNKYGILADGWEVSIYENNIEGNEIGIRTRGCNAITINNNHFEDNEIGLKLDDSKISISENNFIDNGVHANFDNLFSIFHLFFPFQFRSNWMNNYWDDWKLPIPKPIKGRWGYFSLLSPQVLGPFPT